jgi:hypothetical protein
VVRRAAIIALLSLAVASCRRDSDVQGPKNVTIVPDLTGYRTIPLAALEKRPDGSANGTFSYMVVDGAIDWYLFATHVSPGRAYRVVLTTADGKEYAVASHRARADGSLGVHGVETALMNRQCVGAEDPARRPLETARALRVALKSDGSARGASGNDMVGSRSALPCGGNGDGDFTYVLTSADSILLGH